MTTSPVSVTFLAASFNLPGLATTPLISSKISIPMRHWEQLAQAFRAPQHSMTPNTKSLETSCCSSSKLLLQHDVVGLVRNPNKRSWGLLIFGDFNSETSDHFTFRNYPSASQPPKLNELLLNNARCRGFSAHIA